MKEKVLFIFWDGRYRLLSTGLTGGTCGSREEAVMALYDSIAARESTAGYLNQLYDNAQVELQTDNMQLITVRDHFYVEDIYAQPEGPDSAELTFSPHGEPVGMAYAPKSGNEPEPDFVHALEKLRAQIAERRQAYLREDEKMLES